MKELHSSTELSDVQERKRKRRATLVKLGTMTVFAAVIWLFSTIAWFAMNKDTSASGMSVKIGTPKYEISFLDDGSNGIYYDVHELIREQSGSSAMIWQMTDDNNMKNHSYGETKSSILPNSYGVISFNVTPLVDYVNLDFVFEVIGYTVPKPDVSEEDETSETTSATAASTVSAETTTTTALTVDQIDSDSYLQQLLNGHILLFGNRTLVNGDFVYSDPILSNEDMKKVISSKEFSGKDVSCPVNIYWVWPNTLSKLVDATDCRHVSVSEEPFCEGEDYADVVNNVLTYPEYYLRGFERTAGAVQKTTSAVPNETTQPANTLSAAKIAEDYDIYGDLYNQGDNEIGMRVSYVLLKLTVSESDSGGE